MAASISAQSIPSHRYGSVGRWFVTTNHKDIGVLYIVMALVFFVLGGLEALKSFCLRTLRQRSDPNPLKRARFAQALKVAQGILQLPE